MKVNKQVHTLTAPNGTQLHIRFHGPATTDDLRYVVHAWSAARTTASTPTDGEIDIALPAGGTATVRATAA